MNPQREMVSDTPEGRKLVRADTPEEKLLGVWIWEYVLKHTSDVSFIRELTESLLFPKDVARLKQMILIKELSFQVSKDLDVEKTLDILEALCHACEGECLDKAGAEPENVVPSKRFKASSSGAPKVRNNAGEEFVLQGILQPTFELKEKLQKLLTSSVGEQVEAQNAKVKVIESELSALIKSAWAGFGPVFLEKTEAAVINGQYKPEGVSLLLPPASAQNMLGTEGKNGSSPGNEEFPENARRVLDECGVELQKDVSGGNEDLRRARQELANSCVELQKVVKDPLPALLRNRDGTTEASETVLGKTDEPDIRRSLFEPHPSARGEGWDEEPGDLQGSPSQPTPSASRRIQLPPIHSPERPNLLPQSTMASALPLPNMSGIKPRRQKRKWTDEEVETLKREVRKFGKGRWKFILERNLDVFHERTEVDMKDKWRNLEKYNGV